MGHPRTSIFLLHSRSSVSSFTSSAYTCDGANMDLAGEQQGEQVNRVKEQAIYQLGELYAKLGYVLYFADPRAWED